MVFKSLSMCKYTMRKKKENMEKCEQYSKFTKLKTSIERNILCVLLMFQSDDINKTSFCNKHVLPPLFLTTVVCLLSNTREMD